MPARQERESESDRGTHRVRNHRATARALGKRPTRVREAQTERERGRDARRGPAGHSLPFFPSFILLHYLT